MISIKDANSFESLGGLHNVNREGVRKTVLKTPMRSYKFLGGLEPRSSHLIYAQLSMNIIIIFWANES